MKYLKYHSVLYDRSILYNLLLVFSLFIGEENKFKTITFEVSKTYPYSGWCQVEANTLGEERLLTLFYHCTYAVEDSLLLPCFLN